jgi:hypothetical protein
VYFGVFAGISWGARVHDEKDNNKYVLLFGHVFMVQHRHESDAKTNNNSKDIITSVMLVI